MRWKSYYILVETLLHFVLNTLIHFASMLLHFALVLHFAAILITFCVSVTFCGDYYILRRHIWLLVGKGRFAKQLLRPC